MVRDRRGRQAATAGVPCLPMQESTQSLASAGGVLPRARHDR
jgi:hypothetical protein